MAAILAPVVIGAVKARRTLVVALATFGTMTAPTVALATHATSAVKPPAPLSGHRRIHPTQDRDVSSGSFVVTKHHRNVTDLRLVPGDGVAQGYCGTEPVRILGHHHIHRVTGTSEGTPYDEWIVGKNKPKDVPPEQAIKVTAKEAGDPSYPAQMLLTFNGKHRGTGDVGWNLHGNDCDMQFTFTTG